MDAFYWLKTPGESDGCTQTLPGGGRCARFDTMCASVDSIGSKPSEPRAPEAGRWFDYQIKMLGANAVPFPGPPSPPSPPSPGPSPKPSPPSPPSPPKPPPPPSPGTCANKGWAQCGGKTWKGPVCCPTGFKCVASGDYWAQCLPAKPASTKPFNRCTTETCAAGYTCARGACMPTAARIAEAAHSPAFNAMLAEARRREAVEVEAP